MKREAERTEARGVGFILQGGLAVPLVARGELSLVFSVPLVSSLLSRAGLARVAV